MNVNYGVPVELTQCGICGWAPITGVEHICIGSKEVDLQKLHSLDVRRAISAAEQLTPMAHQKDCPVFTGASADCVLPFVACVPIGWEPQHEPREGS